MVLDDFLGWFQLTLFFMIRTHFINRPICREKIFKRAWNTEFLKCTFYI